MDVASWVHQSDNTIVLMGQYFSDQNTVSSSLNQPKFRISSDDYSYRLINHWESNGLIEPARSEGKGWRKYSPLDVIWLSIIKNLRSFGFPIDKIHKVRESFKHVWAKTSVPYPALEYYAAETIYRGHPTYLIIGQDGASSFCFKHEYDISLMLSTFETHIQMSLKHVIKNNFPNLNLKPNPVSDLSVSKKELELFYLLRTGQFDQIKIQLQNGEIHLIESTETYDKLQKYSELIRKSPYQHIEIIVEGNLVKRIRRTEKTKL